MSKNEKRQYAESIKAAIDAIAGDKPNKAFVRVERVMRRDNMAPTQNQDKLYKFVKRHGFVPLEWTLGMHWGMLGGLMARGLIVRTEQEGKQGITAW